MPMAARTLETPVADVSSRERIMRPSSPDRGRSFASRGGALLLVAVALVAAVGVACVRPIQGDPIIFVHGQSGSAQQFETNYMRFAANGFPQQRMYAYEYDSTRN